MKKVLESELLAQLRRDMVDAAVRMAYAEAEFVIRDLEEDEHAVIAADVRLQNRESVYRKTVEAFQMVARENLTALPDEAYARMEPAMKSDNVKACDLCCGDCSQTGCEAYGEKA